MSDFPTVSINALRIPVSADLGNVRRGNHVLVVAGQVVALDTSVLPGDLVTYLPAPQKQLPPPVPTPSERREREWPDPVRLVKKNKPKPKKPLDPPTFTPDDIFEIIAQSDEPVTSMQVADKLAVPRGSLHRVFVTKSINGLIQAGRVVITDDRKTLRWFAAAEQQEE